MSVKQILEDLEESKNSRRALNENPALAAAATELAGIAFRGGKKAAKVGLKAGGTGVKIAGKVAGKVVDVASDVIGGGLDALGDVVDSKETPPSNLAEISPALSEAVGPAVAAIARGSLSVGKQAGKAAAGYAMERAKRYAESPEGKEAIKSKGKAALEKMKAWKDKGKPKPAQESRLPLSEPPSNPRNMVGLVEEVQFDGVFIPTVAQFRNMTRGLSESFDPSPEDITLASITICLAETAEVQVDRLCRMSETALADVFEKALPLFKDGERLKKLGESLGRRSAGQEVDRILMDPVLRESARRVALAFASHFAGKETSVAEESRRERLRSLLHR